ncbi:ABC transporter permease [Paenibacillus sp. AR247]|uniref:ABC transporter permease n=1 Tax=Paenibacillus sp. AR247 TaxID=1631599 RepID=UPI000CF96154|nr:DUF2705 family protein [Paenibacillus sp. AR247]PQP90795.1 ABC transporter permease [Paenibacillus sp. AR247]
MGSFIHLVQNENMKIYRRARTWIMLSILVIVNILMPLLFHLADGGGNISLWESVLQTGAFTFFLCTIFSVVVASDSVAGEFSWGTIKLLLIRPWSRSKILLSKYIAVVLFSLLCTVLLIVVSYGVSAIFFSGGAGGSLMGERIGPRHYFLIMLCDYVDLFMTVALAFMLSAVFRASGLAIGLSLFIMFAKGIFNMLFNPERYSWAKFLPFMHMDLSQYLASSVGPGGVTLGFSILILAIYYVLFLVIAWTVFGKRDVAA